MHLCFRLAMVDACSITYAKLNNCSDYEIANLWGHKQIVDYPDGPIWNALMAAEMRSPMYPLSDMAVNYAAEY